MAMNMAGSSGGGGRRGRRRAVMAEINVTPMVDVMLVLLIIFMVSAPLLTVGVPLDLPQTQAKSLEQDKTPLQLSVDRRLEEHVAGGGGPGHRRSAVCNRNRPYRCHSSDYFL